MVTERRQQAGERRDLRLEPIERMLLLENIQIGQSDRAP
jgi:hypothetical protein